MSDPFSVRFPMYVHNLYDETIYITALLVVPPAGWTDSEENIGTLPQGASVAYVKSNATRALPTAGTNESVTLQVRYRSGGYGGTIIGSDDFIFTIYWESITAGVVVSTDDFETPCTAQNGGLICEGWYSDHSGNYYQRNNVFSRYGGWSLRFYTQSPEAVIQASKTVSIPSASRAAIFGWIQWDVGRNYFRITTPVETQTFINPSTDADIWWRWGARLTPGVSNQVVLETGVITAFSDMVYLDYIRWCYW